MTSIQMIHLATRHFGATLPPDGVTTGAHGWDSRLGGSAAACFTRAVVTWDSRLLHTCRGHLCSRCLSAAPLLDRRFLEPELAALNQPVTAPDPVVEGYARFDPATTGPIKVGNITLGFDPATGALTQLVDDGGGGGRKSWATPANPLLGVNYQTYNISQFEAFQRAYVSGTSRSARTVLLLFIYHTRVSAPPRTCRAIRSPCIGLFGTRCSADPMLTCMAC